MIKAKQMQVFVRPILANIPACQKLLEHPQALELICRALTDPANTSLAPFIDYLQNQQGLPPKAILQVLTGFINHPEVRKELKGKLTACWLMFRIYELKSFLSMEEEHIIKRTQIASFFSKIDFPKSNLLKILRECLQLIKGTAPEEKEVVFLKGKVEEGRKLELEQLFSGGGNMSFLQYNPDKSIPEQLDDLVADYRYFPTQSIEKDLQKELVIAFADLHPEMKVKLHSLESDLKPINSKISHLETKFIREYSTLLSPEIANIFKQLKSKPKEEGYILLSALKAHFNGINVLELERLVKKTQNAQKTIQDKDVILLVGGTGSGKSTSILKFLGYQLKEEYFNSLSTLVPTKQLAPEHRTFHTSPQAKSCTRFINAVPIPDSIYSRGTPAAKKTFVICDSPGLGDSAGVQVDIANGVGMINALSGARSVRVVVLIPYTQITANRGEGLITISEAIGGIFTDIQRDCNSITILFNKVPEEEIEQIPHLIRNKLDNLTVNQNSNDALSAFLKRALEAAQDPDNFLNPLTDDYRPIFQRIITKKEFVYDPQSSFHYDFTQKTKRDIQNYAIFRRGKIKDCFNAKKYDTARLQLKMIEKLKNILYQNDSVQKTYKELTKHIVEGSLRELAKFQEILIQKLMTGDINQRQAGTMRQCREKVIDIANKFADFEGISLASPQAITDIISAQQEKLMAEFQQVDGKDEDDVLRRIKSFCRELSPEFQIRFIAKLQRQFEMIRVQMIKLLDMGNTESMLDVSKRLKWLYKSLNHLKDNQSPYKQQMDSIKKLIEELFKNNMQELQQQLLGDSIPNERVMEYSKKNLIAMKNIEALGLSGSMNPRKWINLCTKGVKMKCLRLLKELQSQIMKLIGQELYQYATPAGLASLKPLLATEKQIQLLMSFENIRTILSDDLNAIKHALSQKLQANSQVLVAYISDIKGERNISIVQQIGVIKCGFDVLVKCCELVGARDAQVHVTQAIEAAVIDHVQRERSRMNLIQLKLISSFKDNFPKIQKLYDKMTALGRLSTIGQGAKALITEFHEQFIIKLRAPFKDFRQNQIASLQQKNQYTYLPVIWQKFDRLSFYAMEMERVLQANSQYNDISIDENEIGLVLQIHLDIMRQQSKAFIDLEIQDLPQPSSIKQVLKVITAIAQRENACKYLLTKMCVDIFEIRASFKQKLQFIKGKIEQKLENYQCAQNKIVYLQKLISAAKFYAGVEEILKLKHIQAIKFKELEKRISQSYIDNLNNDEECAISFIRGNRPSQICFPQVAVIYRQFCSLPSIEGIRKRGIITSQFKKLERAIIDSLRKAKYAMSGSNEDFVQDRAAINQFADDFIEGMLLQKELSELYQGEDKRLVEIGQFTKDLAKISLQYFNQRYTEILQLLKGFHFSAVQNKISRLGYFQGTLYEIPYFVSIDQQVHQGLAAFLDEARNELWKEIRKYEEVNQSVVPFQEKKKIQDLLWILRQKIKVAIQGKFCWYNSEKFALDEDFAKYYGTFRNVDTQQAKDRKEGLQYNIKVYFNKLLKGLKEKKGTQADESINKMQTNFNYLPFDLRSTYASALEAIKSGNIATVNLMETQQKAKSKSMGQLYTDFVDKYIAKNQDSFLQETLKQHFQNQKVKMMERVISTQAFDGFQGPFFDELSASQFFIRRLKKELTQNQQLIKQFWLQFNEIASKQLRLQRIRSSVRKLGKMGSFSTMMLKRVSSA